VSTKKVRMRHLSIQDVRLQTSVLQTDGDKPDCASCVVGNAVLYLT